MTIDDYLQVLPNYTFPKRSIDRALSRNKIVSGSEAFPSNETAEWTKQRDLAEADMWEAASGLANISGGTKKLESRSITDKGFQISAADRLAWRAEADKIRSKYGGEIRPEIYDATKYWQ